MSYDLHIRLHTRGTNSQKEQLEPDTHHHRTKLHRLWWNHADVG